jgi:hypothetical protein
MKTLALFLGLAVSAFAADGYQHETHFLGLDKLNVRDGEIVKVKQFMTESVGIPGKTVDVIVRMSPRHTGKELQLTVTASQWSLLKYTNTMYLRKDGAEWVYIGYAIYRDASGQVAFR